nr:MAG TPA: hypothetical protein [Caudoviricetes sp.]
MTVRIERPKTCLAPMPGHGNAVFYGWAFVNGKRVGTVDKFDSGKYRFAPDYDRNNPATQGLKNCITERTLSALKKQIGFKYE